MRTRHNTAWMLVLAGAFSTLQGSAARAASLNLVQDGKAVYTIVVPDRGEALPMSAATMLAEKVEKASS